MAHSGSRPPESAQGKLFMEDPNKTKVESDRLVCFLKLPFFFIQKAASPKNGVEFRKKSIGAIRSSLAKLHNTVRCLQRVSGWWVGV